MLSALDSNILVDLWNANPIYAVAARSALLQAHAEGIVLLSDIAYAEVWTQFSTHRECDHFLEELNIRVESLSATSSFMASRLWLSYLRGGGKRTRILPDFLIAAHASIQADQLITRDRGFYRSHFPKLKIVDPSKP